MEPFVKSFWLIFFLNVLLVMISVGTKGVAY